MALSQRQFEAFKIQLQKKKESLGATSYQEFLGRVGAVTPIVPETSLLETGGGFFEEELRGGADITGLTGLKRFGAELFQSTLGSKGLLGVAQLPGKVFGQKSIIETQTKLDEAKAQTFDIAANLIKRIREEKDPEILARLQESARGMDDELANIQKAEEDLSRFKVTPKEAIGTSLAAGATVAPVGKFLGATKILKLVTTLRESLRGAAFTTATAFGEDRLPTTKELATGATVGAAVPTVGGVLGAVVKKTFSIAGQVVKSIAGALGVSFDDIARNPKAAQEVAERLLGGKDTVQSVLRTNAENLLKSVQSFRQRLRANFGNALESLSEKQIALKDIKEAAIQALKNNGITTTKTGFSMEAAEFTTPPLVKRATTIINDINNLKTLDGKSLRNLISRIEALKFKSPGADPERLAFNALMKDLSKGLSNAVAKSTPELQAANKAFSEGMQIVEVMEQEFGKVKFANLKELNIFAKKMENLLTKKGIAPEVIDDFLTQIGKDPTVLRAEEAVRGAFAKEIEAEAAGINPITLIRSLTAGIISPKDVARLSITVAKISNTTEQMVRPLIEGLAKIKPLERAAVMRSLIQLFGQDE